MIVCELTLTSVETADSTWHRVTVDHAVFFGRSSVLWMLLVIHGCLQHTTRADCPDWILCEMFA